MFNPMFGGGVGYGNITYLLILLDYVVIINN